MQKNIVCKDIANDNWNPLVKKKMKRWRKSLKNRINLVKKQMMRKKRKDQGQLVVANLERIPLQNLEVVPDRVQDLDLKGSPGVLHAHDLGPNQDLVQDQTLDQGNINKIIFLPNSHIFLFVLDQSLRHVLDLDRNPAAAVRVVHVLVVYHDLDLNQEVVVEVDHVLNRDLVPVHQ